MSGIVEKLRAGGNDFCADGPCWPGDDMLEAADEITRLRTLNAEKEAMLLNQAKTIKEMQAENDALRLERGRYRRLWEDLRRTR